MRFKKMAGFSLIETLLYSVLVATITGLVTLFTWQMITSHQRDRETQSVIENQNFVIQKVNGLVYGTPSALVLPVSGSSPNLEITKTGNNHVVIDVQSGVIRLGRDTNGDGTVGAGDVYRSLTNSHVTVSNLLFERQTINGSPVIRLTATLTGQSVTRTIDTTYYLL